MTIFQYVHCAKRTFNDLKLQNVMINLNQNSDGEPQVFLIDFGFATKYHKKDGKEHISESETVDEFMGNFAFSSLR